MVIDVAGKYLKQGRDSGILLHTALVTGFNLSLRFDEVGKLRIEHCNFTSGGIEIHTGIL